MLKRVLPILPFGVMLQQCLMAEPSAMPTKSGAVGVLSEPIVYRVLKDVSYQGAEPAERADLYLPVHPAMGLFSPGVIWMHGNHHDKGEARERNICSNLAAAGYIALSINYGTWPDSDAGEEHSPRILQNIANARNAVRFLRTHAPDYGVDPTRIALFGGSAGGWLALMVGLTGGEAEFDSSPPYPGVSSGVSAIGDFYADVDGWLKSRITAKSPPVLIIQGKADPAVDYRDSIGLGQALEAQGVPNELILLENVGHAFDLTTWQNKPLPRDLRPVVLAFLEKYLAPPSSRASSSNRP
ncbi:MAG TPA: alpha/beta hydrolase [Opitutaceae bacterium]|nr:alpha/beta hydrolase [Opitutaceae bacterium]